MSIPVASHLDFQGVAKAINLPQPSAAQDAATRRYVDEAIVAGTGGTPLPTPSTVMSRDASARSQVATPVADADIANKFYIDEIAGDAGPFTDTLARRGPGGVLAVGTPVASNDAATKDYVDLLTMGLTPVPVLTGAGSITDGNVPRTAGMVELATTIAAGNLNLYGIIPNSRGLRPLTVSVPDSFIGSQVTVVNESGGTAANRFHLTGGDLVLKPGYRATFIYSPVISRWILQGTSHAVFPGDTSANPNTLALRDVNGYLYSKTGAGPTSQVATKDYVDTSIVARIDNTKTSTNLPSDFLTGITVTDTGSSGWPTVEAVVTTTKASATEVEQRLVYNGTGMVIVRTASGASAWSGWTTQLRAEDASDSNTPGLLVQRDASGNAEIGTPTAGSHIANKSYVDGIAPGVSAPTPSTTMKRDVAGRSQVEAPSAAKDIANKAYVDSTKRVVAMGISYSSASLTLTTSGVDVTGCVISVTGLQVGDTIVIDGIFDVSNPGGTFVGHLAVGGVTQTPEAHLVGTTQRATVAQSWHYPVASAGNTTIKLLVRSTTAGGTCHSGHTAIKWTVYR